MKSVKHFGFASLAAAGLALLLLGTPAIAAARQDSAQPVAQKKVRRHPVARKVAVVRAAAASADSETTTTAETTKTPAGTAAAPPATAPRDNSSDVKVDTTQFDEEARAAEQELQGRFSEAQKKFDEDAAPISSEPAQSHQSAPSGETPAR